MSNTSGKLLKLLVTLDHNFEKKNKFRAQARDGQMLLVHLREVAEACRTALTPYGLGELGYIAGLLHDVGKYNPAFQRAITGQHKAPYHSIVGSLLIGGYRETNQSIKLLQYAIAGHHAGLADYVQGTAPGGALMDRLENDASARLLEASVSPHDIQQIRLLLSELIFPEHDFALATRTISSALIDADRNNAAAHENRGPSRTIPLGPEQQEKAAVFMAALDVASERTIEGQPCPYNRARQRSLMDIRRDLRCDAISHACDPRGVFTLSASLGSGKTFAYLMFAAHHARYHGMKRIIIVSPQTTITAEIAASARDLFGSELVLEHHCNVDDAESQTEQATIMRVINARENWDGFSIIVTTSVQFIESMYTAKAGRSRKLNRYGQSVIVIDEVQISIPARFTDPVSRDLRELVENYESSVLLVTATHPDFSPQQWKGFEGLTGIEINGDLSIFERTIRVKPEIFGSLTTYTPWSMIADQLVKCPTVLCVVNEVAQANELAALMPTGTFVLTTRLCAAHRAVVLREIKQRLKDRLPTRVVSTSLIETGVNLDFPVVFRACTGLASVIQAAGRCNREWLEEFGRYVIFLSHDGNQDPDVKKQKKQTVDVLKRCMNDLSEIFRPRTFKKYSRQYLASVSLDAKDILGDLAKARPAFRTASEKVNLIEDDTVAVLVPYGDVGKGLITSVRRGELIDWSKVQNFSVSLRRNDYDKLVLRKLVDDTGLIPYTVAYDPERGLLLN